MDGAWIMKVDILSNHDDWVAIYVDGDIHFQDHSIPHRVWAELLVMAGVDVHGAYCDFEALGLRWAPSTLDEMVTLDEEERLVDGC
jgi:hypothetical protein